MSGDDEKDEQKIEAPEPQPIAPPPVTDEDENVKAAGEAERAKNRARKGRASTMLFKSKRPAYGQKTKTGE